MVCGPSGTGKSHFLEALGHAAIDAGHHLSWFSLEALGAILRRHRADDTAGRAIKRITRADVIVIDDIGLLPVAAETAEALYRVVDAAYGSAPSPFLQPPPRPLRRAQATPSASPRPPPAKG